MVDNWDDEVPEFERFDKINKEMKQEGECRIVKIVEEPKKISAETVEGAYLKKDISGIVPKDCFIMVVDDNGQKKEFWFNETSFSVRRDLKAVKEANNGSLVGVNINLKRIAVNDRKKSNWKIESAKKAWETPESAETLKHKIIDFVRKRDAGSGVAIEEILEEIKEVDVCV